MYKIIIADDEKTIRDGLEKLVDWEGLGFEIVKTLGDGEAVIDFLDSEPVDVVLADIMMPHIGGIEIAKYVKESELTCKVVLISGFKKFELAHQAIRYGVEDYILKPSKMEDVIAVFQKLKRELDNMAEDFEAKRIAQKQWEEMRPVLMEKFVRSLILIGELEDRKDVERRMRLLYPEIDPEHCPCILATLRIHNYEVFLHNSWNYGTEQFDEAVFNYVNISREQGFFHIVYKAKDCIRIFAIMKECGHDACIVNMEHFVQQMMEIFKLNISMEIERLFTCIYQVMDMQREMLGDFRKNVAELQLQEQQKMIMTNMMIGNIGTAQRIMKNILLSHSTENVRCQSHIVVDTFDSICKFLQNNRPRLYQVILPYIDYQRILNMSATAELMLYCDRIFDLMKNQENISQEIDKKGLVNQIKAYVDRNIYKDIFLEDVANEVFISTTHLSRIFKKQTGETFLQYVTRKKMEKAKELLCDPRYKVYQISELLGYKTSRYFSKLFYNHMGCYPNQYRKDALQLGEEFDEEK